MYPDQRRLFLSVDARLLAQRPRLLFWSGLCFGFLSLNSIVVIFDILVFPNANLQVFRHAASLAAVGTLLFGLVWETE